MTTRRHALRTFAIAAATPALKSQHQHNGTPADTKLPDESAFLSPPNLRLLTQAVDRILPRTETPGAVDAGVPRYIDGLAKAKPALAEFLQRGLGRLEKAGFLDATPSQQDHILSDLGERTDPFFKLLKDLSIDGYYGTREGLITELGFQGHTFLAEFPGCTHPEHLV